MSTFSAFALAVTLAFVNAPLLAIQDQTVHSSKEEGIAIPSVVTRVNPQYTREGMQQGIQGSVILSSVVLADGSVGEVSVVQSLDEPSGLDQAAIDAMKQWRFKAGTKDGRAVAVRIECEMTFVLK
jgi:TonB family protein